MSVSLSSLLSASSTGGAVASSTAARAREGFEMIR